MSAVVHQRLQTFDFLAPALGSRPHYHRPLVEHLVAGQVEVVELNPAAVKAARGQQLRARQKTDERDLAAIADLLIRGAGRPPQQRTGALLEQAAWVGHRRRKVDMGRRLRQQIHAQLDPVFPGLGACFGDIFDTRSGRMILTEFCNPERVVRLGTTRLANCTRTRGIRMSVAKAEQIVACAREALTPQTRQRDLVEQLLAADLAMFITVEAEILRCERELAALIAATPAGVLTSIPGVGVVRASAYGAALGDHTRFTNADAAYAFAGLSPASYESAGRVRPVVGITKSGSVTLRQAILELGKGMGMGMHHPDFADYRARLISRGKPRPIAAVAVAHRAHRVAFALMRDGVVFDSAHPTPTSAGRPVTTSQPTQETT